MRLIRLPTMPAWDWSIVLTVLAAVLGAVLLTWSPPGAAATLADNAVASGRPIGTDTATDTDIARTSRALERAQAAVLGLRVTAIEGARSAATLGQRREGSGIVIGADGLVLTIGYLVLEADQVSLLTDDGRTIAARVVGYDVASGFGLVQALAPLGIAPVPLGDAPTLQPGQVLMVASGGAAGAVSAAQLVARRDFSGFWEYHISGALFTAPARNDHSGAGLFDARGALLGVGSLVMSDVADDRPAGGARQPGNMFVPVDLLRPILAELRTHGRSSASARAWVGINCVERNGGLQIVRVADDSPADVAGLQVGDRILAIDGQAVSTLAALWQTLWIGGAEREITLDIERDHLPSAMKVYSVDRMATLRRAEGI